MAQIEWIVFTCRACQGLIKLSPGLATAGSVICPKCRTKMPIPKDAAHIEEESRSSQLPSTRNTEPGSPNLRGPLREGWEVGNRTTGGDLEFRERLHRTTEPEFRDDPQNPAMKRVNMRRRKHERTHRDFDNPGMAEERSDKDSRREMRKKARRHYKNNGRKFADYFIRLLVGALVVLAGVVGWLAYDRLKKKAVAAPPTPIYMQVKDLLPQDADGPPLEQRGIASFATPLRDIIRRFASAATVEEILPLIRDRERVEPLLRAYYTKRRPWEPFDIRNKFEAADFASINGNFIFIDLILLNFETRLLLLERRGESFLADWESFTGHGEVEWPDLIPNRPEEPVLMRVFLEQSASTGYYNEDFSDEKKWACYSMRDQTGAHQFSAYVARGSETEITLKQRMFQAPAAYLRRAAAVVKLRFLPGGKSVKQVEITHFMENGWVLREGNDIKSPQPAPLPSEVPQSSPEGQKPQE